MAGNRKAKVASSPMHDVASFFDHKPADAQFNTSTQAGLEAWIYWQYRQNGFRRDGTFKGLKWLRGYLFSLDTLHSKTKIRHAIQPLLNPSHKFSLAHTDQISEQMKTKAKAGVRVVHSQSTIRATGIDDATSTSASPSSFRSTLSQEDIHPVTPTHNVTTKDGLLAWKLNRLKVPKTMSEDEVSDSDTQDYDSAVEFPSPASEYKSGHDSLASFNGVYDDMDFLLSNDSGDDDSGEVAQIQHAPLLDGNIIPSNIQHLLPQYGLLGSHNEARYTKSKLFLNTNIPFSIFLCGVQGSGKSHTTACILENSLIISKNLGKLQNPLSALVFSYGHFSGDGAGFSISEAAFLASPNPKLPGGAHVKKVNVLVSPSNYLRISKLYLQLPNISVAEFKLKPCSLDIDTMLTLMNVSESDETPLYMAQITQILREMATTGKDFNYMEFKLLLQEQKFNPVQVNMLQMRLNLLESFLDLDNSCPEPQFRAGEITIMDMSCPFVDANTACILFRIGLQHYLQSKAPGKMIVLDEAHKYMLNVPGAKSLNETLLHTIRLQRHCGARVIISTQEPTLLTDLISLCSVTVIHRFSSPEWFLAIKRHIPITAEDGDSLMRKIESLKTGNAIVYSSNAILGRDEGGEFIMGTSRMITVSIRKRITSDGGRPVLAV